MNKTTGAIIGVLIGIVVATTYNDYKHQQRISSLEEKVGALERSSDESSSKQEEINLLQKNFNNDQLYFNTYIYQTLIVNRGKPL